MPMKKRIRMIALCVVLAIFAWCGILGCMIWCYGNKDHAVKSDCIIVLGAAVNGAEPSPVFAERIRHGIQLYQQGDAPWLLFTGGQGEGQMQAESRVGLRVAMEHQVPAKQVLIEEPSRTTHQNLEQAAMLMREHGLKSAIIVSDPLHMKRAMMMAEDLGIDAVSSPTPTTRYRSLKTRFGFLIRELYFYHHYLVTGE